MQTKMKNREIEFPESIGLKKWQMANGKSKMENRQLMSKETLRSCGPLLLCSSAPLLLYSWLNASFNVVRSLRRLRRGSITLSKYLPKASMTSGSK